MEAVYLPKRLVEEVERRGMGVEDLILDVAMSVLNLDPQEVARARVEIAEKSLGEAEEYLKRGDAAQASGKLYKAVEECVKALAEKYNAPQLAEVNRRGRWTTWLLGQASTDLAKMLNEERIRLAWSLAYDVHVWGFHEARYRPSDVEAALPLAKWLLEYAKKAVM